MKVAAQIKDVGAQYAREQCTEANEATAQGHQKGAVSVEVQPIPCEANGSIVAKERWGCQGRKGEKSGRERGEKIDSGEEEMKEPQCGVQSEGGGEGGDRSEEKGCETAGEDRTEEGDD